MRTVYGANCPIAMARDEFQLLRDFALIKEIGSGTSSCVWQAMCTRSFKSVAIKMYNKMLLTILNKRQVEREIAIHSSIQHANIVDFYAAFEDEQRIYLVLEFAAGGDLFDITKLKGGRLAESEVALLVIKPYLEALSYLHSNGIIHRDIKPENTVFTNDKVLKITDFGLAINQREERPVTRLGTLDYMAPEVIQCPDKHHPSDNKHRIDLIYGERVDAWAMGILAYELVVGRSPFGMSDRESTIYAITSSRPSFPAWTSQGVQSFVLMALEKSPATRAPILRLMQHPWIVSFVDMAQQPNPQKHQLAALVHNPALARNSPVSSGSFSARSSPKLQQLFQTFNTPSHSVGIGRLIEVASTSHPSSGPHFHQGTTVGMPPLVPPTSSAAQNGPKSQGSKKVSIRRKQHQRSNTHGSGSGLDLGFETGLDPPTAHHPEQWHQHRVLWAESVVDPQQHKMEGGSFSPPRQELTFSAPSISRSLSQSSKRRVPDEYQFDPVSEDLLNAARSARLLSQGRCASGELVPSPRDPSFHWSSHASLPPSLINSPTGSMRSGHQAHFASNLNPSGRPSVVSPPSPPQSTVQVTGGSPFSNSSKGSRLGRSNKVHRSHGGQDYYLTPTNSGSLLLPQAHDAAAASSHQAALLCSYSPDVDGMRISDDDRPSVDVIAAAVAREWRGELSIGISSAAGATASGATASGGWESRGSGANMEPWSNRTSHSSNRLSFESGHGGIRKLARGDSSMNSISQKFASTNLNNNWTGGALEAGPGQQAHSPHRQTFNGLNIGSRSQSSASRMSHPSLPLPFISEQAEAGASGHQGPGPLPTTELSVLSLFSKSHAPASNPLPSETRPSIFETFGWRPAPPQLQFEPLFSRGMDFDELQQPASQPLNLLADSTANNSTAFLF